MKVSYLLPLVLAALTNAHCIFQKISVNGVDQGQLKAIRAPNNNNPIQNVNDANMACNAVSYKDNNIINVPAGANIGGWWGHIIGGPQSSNDPDHPIAPSHKGPAIVYLAKVDNAASTGNSGLRWFKIFQEGLNNGNGRWGVDSMISTGGWTNFQFPSCIAPGNYLIRFELIALHSAYSAGGAQFYIGCAQINVTGSGTSTGSNFVSFPGAYQSNDPGITLNIYSGTVPNNGGKPYSVPGPAVLNCANAPAASTTQPAGTTTVTNPQPTSGGGGTVPLYGQCGGTGWTGGTSCAQGTCSAVNTWYSQCLP